MIPSVRRSALRALLALAFTTMAAVVVSGCVPDSGRGVAVGEPLPPFELPSLDGGSFSSADLAGDGPVVVNFWATWCGPCIHEIPALRNLHASGEVRVVSVNVDSGNVDSGNVDSGSVDSGSGSSGGAAVRDFVRRHGIEYDVLLGDVGMVAQYGSMSIPYTLVLDQNLTVRALHRVAVSASVLERDVRAAR